MRLLIIAIITGIVWSSAWLPAEATELDGQYLQQTDKGSVNWMTGAATSIGIGAAPPNAANAAQARALALRAATVVARRNLLELLKGVQVDSATTVQNFMIADDTVLSKVQGLLQQSQVMDTKYMSDGSVEVTVGVSIRGNLAAALAPLSLGMKSAPAPSGPTGPPQTLGRTGQDVPAVTPPPTRPAVPDETGAMPAPASGGFSGVGRSGLIVDARGLGVKPALSPKIYDEKGNVIYGVASVSRDYAVAQGMAGYVKDIAKAASNERVAGNPLTVKALAVRGQAETDLVIDNAAAETVRQQAQVSDFLAQARVIIVVD